MIRLFVGCAANDEDLESQAVLEWSVRKHTKAEVQITWMQLSRDPGSPFYCAPELGKGWNTAQWATPFSGFRYAIPELCGFEGEGIYADSDVMFMADIQELADIPFQPGKLLLAKNRGRFCVSKWNCEAARGSLPSIATMQGSPRAHAMASALFSSRPDLIQFFPAGTDWNVLDGENYENLSDPKIKALHYTDMGTQPQLKFALPRLAKEGQKHWFTGTVRKHRRQDLVLLFELLLAEAIKNGYPPERYSRPMADRFGTYRKSDLAGYRGAGQRI